MGATMVAAAAAGSHAGGGPSSPINSQPQAAGAAVAAEEEGACHHHHRREERHSGTYRWHLLGRRFHCIGMERRPLPLTVASRTTRRMTPRSAMKKRRTGHSDRNQPSANETIICPRVGGSSGSNKRPATAWEHNQQKRITLNMMQQQTTMFTWPLCNTLSASGAILEPPTRPSPSVHLSRCPRPRPHFRRSSQRGGSKGRFQTETDLQTPPPRRTDSFGGS